MADVRSASGVPAVAAFSGASGTPLYVDTATGLLYVLITGDVVLQATQLASAVAITGGSVNGTTVGASTPSSGAFTTLSTTGAITATGGQIVFPATQVPSSNANTLDDYEEGTFTPTFAGDSTAGSQTYSVQVGRYIKVGKQVHIQGRVVISAKDATTAGNITIAGLPFTSVSTTNAQSAVALHGTKFDWSAGYTQLTISVLNNATVMYIGQSGDNVGGINLPAAGLLADSFIVFGGTYEASA